MLCGASSVYVNTAFIDSFGYFKIIPSCPADLVIVNHPTARIPAANAV